VNDQGDFGQTFDLAARDWAKEFNTALNTEQKAAYDKWAAATGRTKDVENYDLQGYFLKYGAQRGGGHLTDEFKKPNHPTFSTESIYNGTNGMTGGEWQQMPDRMWHFYPSEHNMKLHGVNGLSSYFQKEEKGAVLHLPGMTMGAAGKPLGQKNAAVAPTYPPPAGQSSVGP